MANNYSSINLKSEIEIITRLTNNTIKMIMVMVSFKPLINVHLRVLELKTILNI